jgi:type II secretory pathway predicted ATPase ExeA
VSIVNGSLDLRQSLLDALNLKENPFAKAEPPEAAIDHIFVGRVPEIRAAAMRIVDRPRNLLVWGGYGCGKTTFVRKLLHELHSAKRLSFLTGYTALAEETPQGFQRAALTALCKSARGVTSSEALSRFAAETLDALAPISAGGADAGALDLRFQRGLELAREAGFHRVVLAIDEIDKRDGRAVQAMLLSTRFLLDQDASFVLTGGHLDVFSDVRSSVLAVFDHRIELKPFADAESREILCRNLARARRTPEPEETLRPFDGDAVAQMVARARGLPRPLNLMASAALELALDEATSAGTSLASVTTAHLARALVREGNLIYNEVGAERRVILERMHQRSGYASGAAELGALAPGGLPDALRELDDLSQQDAVLRLEAEDGAAFALSPPVEETLRAESTRRERLRGLWKSAIEAPDAQARGKALEDFAAAFFGDVFTVSERNTRTDTEELDLVLERSPRTNPRFGKEPYLFVECKNWQSRPVDQATISQLYAKLHMRNLRQGFVLATGRFTVDAAQQAKYAVSKDVEIVLIDGHTIADFLAGLRPVGDLLVELHRRQILRAG